MTIGTNTNKFNLIIALLLIATPIDSIEANKPLTLPALMNELAKVKSVAATFTEEKTMAVLNQPITSSGSLAYRAPDYVEKRVTKPQASYFIVSGNNLTISDPQRGEHQVVLFQYPLLEAFVAAVRATLAGDLDTLQEYYEISLNGDKNRWVLELFPEENDMQHYIKQINIHGRNSEILEVVTIEVNNDRTIMRISPSSE